MLYHICIIFMQANINKIFLKFIIIIQAIQLPDNKQLVTVMSDYSYHSFKYKILHIVLLYYSY